MAGDPTFWQNALQGWVGAVLGSFIGAAVGAGAALFVMRRSLRHDSEARRDERAAIQRDQLTSAVMEALEEVAALEHRAIHGMHDDLTLVTYGSTMAVTKAAALALRAGREDLHDALMAGRAAAARGASMAMRASARKDASARSAGVAETYRACAGLRSQLQEWLVTDEVPPVPARTTVKSVWEPDA